jgi:hypothetical protein
VSFGFTELLPLRKSRREELSWKRTKVKKKQEAEEAEGGKELPAS